MRNRVSRLALSCVAALLADYWPVPLAAQSNVRPLFVVTVRDPGPLDVPPTARALALSGTRTLSGAADEAMDIPAALVLGTGTDLVFSGGRAEYSRQEPDKTPPVDILSQASLAWVNTPSNSTPVLFGAIATRRSRWALAGFINATERYEHRFDTADATISSLSSPGGVVSTSYHGAGRGSVSESVMRAGGAVSVAGAGGRIAIGAALYGTRVDYSAGSSIDETYNSSIRFPVPTRSSSTALESEAVEVEAWGLASTLNVVARPTAWSTVSARWKREPRVPGVARRDVVSADPRPWSPASIDAIELALPDVWAASAALALGRTLVAAELARLAYADTFQPTTSSPGCPDYCAGWGLDDYHAATAWNTRIGVEQSVPVAAGAVFLRAGLATGDGYTVSKLLTPNGADLSAVIAFPPRDDARRWSFGAGYQIRRVELAVAIGVGDNRTSVIGDVRIHPRSRH